MRVSRFNVATPMPGSDDTFLFNTLTDTQIVVTPDVVALLDRVDRGELTDLPDESRAAANELASLGFLVESAGAEQAALEQFFAELRDDHRHVRLTLLTTLQCNFACDYCIQGDHGEYNTTAAKMTMEDAGRVASWMEDRLTTLAPERFTLTFFGGEPLLNLPVVYAMAERLWAACQARGVAMAINIITNGLLLTEAVVDRLLPYGLTGVKVTLDGDRTTHDRLRPLRGGQGTFDRLVANMRAVAPKVRLSIGGNFDVESAETYPELLTFLRSQPFADRIVKLAFKPIIRGPNTGRGVIPLTAVAASGAPLGGACMTAAGNGGGGTPCDSCHVVDERMSWLRAETRAQGFSTPDGVHLGPCELHRRHAYTVGPEGSLYPCPGFTGEPSLRVGHVEAARDTVHAANRERFDSHAPWRACGDCSLVPVCGGGCSVASHNEQGDLGKPSCHKPSMLDAVRELAAAAT